MSSHIDQHFTRLRDAFLKIKQYMETHHYNNGKKATSGLTRLVQTEINLTECLDLLEDLKRDHIQLAAINQQLKDAPPQITHNTTHNTTHHTNTNNEIMHINLTPHGLLDNMLQTFNRSIIHRGGQPIQLSDIQVAHLPDLNQHTLHDNMELIADQMHTATKHKNNGQFPADALNEIKNELALFENKSKHCVD